MPFWGSNSSRSTMDANLLKEIHYLTRLIEQHKQKLPQEIWNTKRTFVNQNLEHAKSAKCTTLTERSQSSIQLANEHQHIPANAKHEITSTKVHVNPNFKPQHPVIHINPKVRMKPMIHVNPKMMENVSPTEESLKIKPANVETARNQSPLQSDVKRSVYVNPKLMTKLSRTTEPKPIESKQKVVQETTTYPVCSRLKFIKGTNVPKATPKKAANSSIIILSQRKLVRIRRGSKGSSTSPVGSCKLKKPLSSPFKKVRVAPLKLIKSPKLASMVKQSASADYSLVKVQTARPRINKYRIDRTVSQQTKVKQNVNGPKKIRSNKMELITIGGIVYKSSKNQLVRRSYGSKRKKITNVKNDKFIIATNGKKLCRVKSVKETQGGNVGASTSTINRTKLLCNTLQKSNYKTNISNKVKQKSIQILRNKMRKNNQPCLIFQKFGYCANHEKGTCPKLHDKKQVSLCKKFLQGNCLLDNCPLSHDVGPEKMPTCKYFLEGCCVRDACPYRHVKVSSSTPICIEFLKGYCAKGHECKRRHENLCPEFDKTGKCSKGKYCPYPHKPHSSAANQNDKYLKRKHGVDRTEKTPAAEDPSSSNNENRLRYYEQTETLLEDINKKRERIMKKVKIMKHVNSALHSERANLNESSSNHDAESVADTSQTESESEYDEDEKLPKRPPIGDLPAYIPIN